MLFLLLALVVASAQPSPRDLVGKSFEARVTRVADGDSLEITRSGDKRPIRVRLEAIDAPELSEDFGEVSHAFARRLLANQHVRVIGKDVDRFGRLIARLSVAGRDASTSIVGAGMACHAYVRDPTVADAQSRARVSGVGFWSPRAIKPRCVTRRAPR